MKLLEERILKDGVALNSDVLLVDSFLNHQVDMGLMQEIGREFARIFAGKGINKIATIESSGIAPAGQAALAMGVPLLVMKKSTSSILSEELLQTPVASFTKGSTYQLTTKRKYLSKGDSVLFIDDFLANGEAALGAARLIESAGATVAGIGIVIEKAFQPGRLRLIEAGYHPVSLAAVSHMETGIISFVESVS
ncbi:MAG: xanthine phosphoribosyltransferase [Clostridia bacterium]|nr:xanthine phosphoribosyltransferase [Clostridia bacterium]